MSEFIDMKSKVEDILKNKEFDFGFLYDFLNKTEQSLFMFIYNMPEMKFVGNDRMVAYVLNISRKEARHAINRLWTAGLILQKRNYADIPNKLQLNVNSKFLNGLNDYKNKNHPISLRNRWVDNPYISLNLEFFQTLNIERR